MGGEEVGEVVGGEGAGGWGFVADLEELNRMLVWVRMAVGDGECLQEP